MRRHPRLVDAAVAVAVFAMTVRLGEAAPPPHDVPLVRGILLAGVACGALVMRRRRPVAVLLLTIAGAELYLMPSHANEVVLAAPLIALYTVADVVGWRWSLTIGVPAVLAMAGFHMALRSSTEFGQENLTLLALGALAIAAGAASRNRRAYITEVEERARNAERSQVQEARRQVSEERLRIARELHDVVGHHLALVNVQAGVALHMLDDQPGKAKEALEHVMAASREGLEQLRETIGLLRDPGDDAAPTEPAEGLDGLGELIATFRRSGLRIACYSEGVKRPIPSATDLTAYRVIQESLTNVRKHAGDASTRVRLHYGPRALHIAVENDGMRSQVPDVGRGHGIDGMRERLEAIGGELTAEPHPSGGFRVRALLPLPARTGTA